VQLVVQPRAGRRPVKQIVVIREALPDFAWIRLDGRSISARDAKILERDTVRVEQAEDVVIGLNEEGRRLRERCVVRQNPRIDVAVRRDDG